MRWFYRLTAVHFVVTAVTGLVLYFRRGGGRPGLFGDDVKEWLVMIHNGEWLSYVVCARPVYSGLAVGLILAVTITRHSVRGIRYRPSRGE